MANKVKNRPFMKVIYKTKEEFDKNFDRIFQSGYKIGHKEGMASALSYILESVENIEEVCGKDIMLSALHEKQQRQIANWNRESKYYEELKKQAVEEYIKSQEKKG